MIRQGVSDKLKRLILIYCAIFFLFSHELTQAVEKMNKQTIADVGDLKLKLVQVGDPVLRQEARTLTKEEILSPSIQQLIELMKITMHDAPGVGLAAPQVGVPIQLAVIEDREEYSKTLTAKEIEQRERRPVAFHVIINPKLTILETAPYVDFFEGCLSVSGYMANVSRALAVKVDCLNEKGEPVSIQARGWYARILQHEIDHLHGTLYIDRMTAKTLTTLENYRKFYVPPK